MCASHFSTRTIFHRFQPLLYQVATAQLRSSDIATSLRSSLRGHANVDVRMEEVIAANPNIRTTTTKTGESYTGDFLVLAPGSQVNFFGTAGAEQNAFPLHSLNEAQRLRSRVLAVLEEADRNPRLVEKGALNFVIIGGGPIQCLARRRHRPGSALCRHLHQSGRLVDPPSDGRCRDGGASSLHCPSATRSFRRRCVRSERPEAVSFAVLAVRRRRSSIWNR
jgi:hypothetical protein